MSQEHLDERKDSEAFCNVRLAPLIVTHSVILAVAVVWLVAILTG